MLIKKHKDLVKILISNNTTIQEQQKVFKKSIKKNDSIRLISLLRLILL